MSIKKDYARAYANYLRRVARQVAKGYQVTPIAKTKKPTAASVKHIQSQKAKQIVRRAVKGSEANKELRKKLEPAKKTKRKARPLTAKQKSERTKKGWSDERRQKQSERMKQKWQDKKSGETSKATSNSPVKPPEPPSVNPPESTDSGDPGDYDNIIDSIDALWDKLEDRVTTMGFSMDSALTKDPIKEAKKLDEALHDAIDDGWAKESIDAIAVALEEKLAELNSDVQLGWKLYYEDVESDYSDDEIKQYLIKGDR